MKISIQGRLILITGATGGLGLALAEACAAKGARLILCGRRAAELKRLAKRLGAETLCFDLAKPKAREKALITLRRKGQIPDILINNAGRHMLGKVESLPEGELKSLFELNLYGPLCLIQGLLPAMKSRASGLIVQIASILSYRSLENVGAYSATKAALQRLCESLRMELVGTGLQVLEIFPGVIRTELRKNAWFQGPAPKASEKLPFAQDPETIAREIIRAMEEGRQRIDLAAWPVRLGMRYLNALAPGWMDRILIGKN